MRFLSHAEKKNLNGKTCLLRVDFNITDTKETFRLEAALPTIKFLRTRGAKIVLLSHRGRPPQKFRAANSLKIVLPFLKKKIGPVTFFPHFDFKKIASLIKQTPSRSIFLLENLRFLPGEEKNDIKLARSLASLGEVYTNDAFPVSHRVNASITQLPRLLPSFAGLQLEKEMANLNALLRGTRTPFVIILGGAKASDKIPVIRNFLSRATTFLIAGVPANTFLKAKGLDIGNSLFDKSMLKTARMLLKTKKITLPIDFIMHNDKILDIGRMSVELFETYLKRAKTILWNGPPGIFEDPRFALGSEEIAKIVARSRAFSVVGGGETTTLIRKLHLERRVGFLSTGGGAMLEYLSGKKLPGITALQ